VGEPAPTDFSGAMRNGNVFTMFKCVNPDICTWMLSESEKKREESRMRTKAKPMPFDPCSKYPDCQSCVAAQNFCGWCSVDVLYNGTSPGTQCAGLNNSQVPGFLCTGVFSTVSCPSPPTPGNSKAPTKHKPTTIPPLRPNAPHINSPPPTKSNDWICNPNTTQCVQNATASGGMPFEDCNRTCVIIPDVPIILRGKRFRGLEIEKGYYKGEYTAKFSSTTVTFADPKGTSFTAVVSQTGQYLVMNLPNGQKIFSLWQYAIGTVTDYLSWAWGVPGGAPPASFDSAMNTQGENSFVFDTCSALVGSACSFSK